MSKTSKVFRILAVITVLVMVTAVFISTNRSAGPAGLAAPAGALLQGGGGNGNGNNGDGGPLTIIEGSSVQNDISKPLHEMKPLPPQANSRAEEHENPPLPLIGHIDGDDPVLQTTVNGKPGGSPAPAALTAGNVYEGINQAGGCGNCAPPDTNGDVGLTHYVQTVNSSFAIYRKSDGVKLYGPAAINTIWSGFGGQCQSRNDGDPIVLYDSMADRWLISQFTATSPYNECIAISQTGDPTGAWYRYAFQLSTTDFPDYPHFGIFPDGYYMSVNWFVNGQSYGGPRPYVFNRAAMLTGAAATFQTTSAALGSGVAPLQPADLDGPTQPAAGSPGLFLEYSSPFNLYKFTVNWSTPSASTWAKSGSVTPAKYTALCATSRNCIAQSGTSQKLDGIGDRFMYRLVYRNMGTYESLLAVHSVKASGTNAKPVAGTRWYEIRNPFGTPTMYQQGTYAPADSISRWMGSIAMDKNGSIAIGYSASGASLFPGIRYTGRLATDALGTMTQGEGIMYSGTGFQSGVNRWGDYSNLSVDPSDDCTFWFTTEYNNSKGWAWGTKFGSFRLPGCP
jgi:hypothetical protein